MSNSVSPSNTVTERISIRPFLPNLLLLFFMIAASLSYFDNLPAQVPTRFNLQGQAIEYGSRAVALSLMPLVYGLSLFLLPLLIFAVTKQVGRRMQTAVGRTNTAVGVLFAAIHIGFLMHSAGPRPGLLQTCIVAGIALFMLFISSAFAMLEPNKFIGVRTPWSLSSRQNWDATHKIATKISALSGLLLLLATIFASPSLLLALATLIFAMLMPVFYSLWYYQNFEKTDQ